MLISGGTLVSDCHGAIIYTEGAGPDEEYRCIKCMKPCKSAGTLSEKHERENAIPKEHERLRAVVVDAAKARLKAERDSDPWRNANAATTARISEDEAVDALLAFEAEHKIGETK